VTSNFFVSRIVVAALALGLPAIASAQGTSPAPASQGGPMVVEQVTQRYAFLPEVKVAAFDDSTVTLIGGRGGVLVGSRLLVGAGLYTLVNGDRGRGLTYGGGMVDWQWWNGRLFSGTVGGLVGAGSGTAAQTFSVTDRAGRSFRQTRFLSSNLFVAEPRADVLVRLTKHLHLDVGAGYRLTSAARGQGDTFRGTSGSVALRIGSAQ
jgi:hypothetical protein